jgi:hypothetical protein
MKNGPYELIVAPENFPGMKYRGRYAYEHIVVWWRQTGSVPLPGYHVHHRNGKKRDNRFDNLEMIRNGTHSALHGVKKGKTFTALVCAWCGKGFVREKRNIQFKIDRGQRNFYCCRAHLYKRQRLVLGDSQVGKAENC